MYEIRVTNTDNKIVWKMSYQDINEALTDIKCLMKPSAFGVNGYEVTINKG